MILDLRTYTITPGRVDEYLSIYETEALKVQQAILGRLEGYFISQIGDLNQLVQMWSYEDYGERDRRREKLFSDPTFVAAAKKLYPLIQKQENAIVKPASFSPIK
jgi:NIPSNAP